MAAVPNTNGPSTASTTRHRHQIAISFTHSYTNFESGTL